MYKIMHKEKILHISLAIVLLLALTIRIVYICQIRMNPQTEMVFLSKSFDQYWFNKAAVAIAKGDWLLREIEVTKAALFYSYFLTVIYKLFNFSHLAARIVQAFLGVGTCALLYFIGKEAFNKTAGFISCVIASFYGLFIFYNGVLLRATLITFLNMFVLFLVIRLSKNPIPKFAFFCGITSGLSYVTKENFLIPFILILLFIILKRAPIKKTFTIIGVFALGVILVFVPFIARNYALLGKCLINPTSPEIFWAAILGDFRTADPEWKYSYEELAEKYGANFCRAAQLLAGIAISKPRLFMKVILTRLAMFFNGYEGPCNLNYYLFREFPTVLRFPYFAFTFISPFAILGLLLPLFMKKEIDFKKVGILYVFFFALSLGVMCLNIAARYRMPVVPMFIIFASYALYWCFQEFRSERYVSLLVIAIILFPIFLFVQPDPSYRGTVKATFIRDIDYLSIAHSYGWKMEELRSKGENLDQQFLDNAIKYLKKIIELRPHHKETAWHYFDLGIAYYENGRMEEARENWTRALELEPDFVQAKAYLELVPVAEGEER